MSQPTSPNRWLHLRLPRPWSPAEQEMFRTQASLFERHVEATLALWPELGHGYAAPGYVFFPTEISADGMVLTLPLGGDWTLGSRTLFENRASRLLWEHFPIEVQTLLEEGLTEEHDGAVDTHWRQAASADGAHSPQFAGSSEHPGTLDAVKRALWWVSGILPPA
jgi:hypothetical protein